MDDPIAAFIRGDRETLLRAAPAPQGARLWHEARRRRAASLRLTMGVAGWLVRVALAIAALTAGVLWRSDAYFLLFLFALSVWLTRGACSPSHHLATKRIIE